MSLNLNEFKEEVHANADAHGWWQEKKSYGELTALFHSELSEALEEYRNSRQLVYEGENGKPEGIAIELIDCVIRIFDFFGAVGATMKGFDNVDDAIHAIPDDIKEDIAVGEMKFTDFIAFLHCQITHAYEHDGVGSDAGCSLMVVCALVFYWIRLQGENPEALLIKKHEYNVNRPYRHGNKVC